jgi:gluconolactonase
VVGIIETIDPRLEGLLDPGAELERVAEGFVFTEGPVWDFRARRLLFSDIPADTMYVWDAGEGAREYRKPSSFSNGLTFDADGALIACEHRTRRVTRERHGTVEVVADSYAGKRLNAPNDIVLAHDGTLVFTDPHYGLGEGFGGPAEQELDFRGVYRLAQGSSEPELLARDFNGPNGLALSPDGRTLYVADTEEAHIRAFHLGESWKLGGGEMLVELPADGEGVLDGLKLDAGGNIYCTGPGGIWICSPQGELLGRIRFPEVAANLAWGDDDARTLYVTASTGLYRLRCKATGHVPYPRRGGS